MAAGSGSGRRPPGAFGHPGRSGGTAGMETSREWALAGCAGDSAGSRSPPPNVSAFPLFYLPTVTFPRAVAFRLGPAVVMHVSRAQPVQAATWGECRARGPG